MQNYESNKCFTQLYTTLHNSTYTTLHNSTQLPLHNLAFFAQQTIQNLSKICKTFTQLIETFMYLLRLKLNKNKTKPNYTPKTKQNYTERYKTIIFNKFTQLFFTQLYKNFTTTLQNFTKLLQKPYNYTQV